MRKVSRTVFAVLMSLCFASAFGAGESQEGYKGDKSKLHVYLLIGQSNMAGRAPFEGEDAKVIDGCYLFNQSNEWESAKNPLNIHSTIRKSVKMQKMNPGYGFAKTMIKNDPDTSIGLVVNAKGGTRIEQWAKGTQFYKEALKRTRAAMKSGTLKGILWHQGESNSKGASGYSEKLKTLVENLREDLGAPKLPFVAGQVFYDEKKKPHTDKINEEIAKLPSIVPSTAVVSSEGLTTSDSTHFDTEGMKALGQRYAEQILQLQK